MSVTRSPVGPALASLALTATIATGMSDALFDHLLVESLGLNCTGYPDFNENTDQVGPFAVVPALTGTSVDGASTINYVVPATSGLWATIIVRLYWDLRESRLRYGSSLTMGRPRSHTRLTTAAAHRSATFSATVASSWCEQAVM